MASWGKHTARIPPHGQIRISQVVSTFGPGALVDLVDAAVLVGGLDFWVWGKGQGVKIITEPRLRDAVAHRLERAGRRPLSLDEPFREPPMGDDKEPKTGVGIQVLEFPAWFVCQNPECRALVRAADGLEKKGLRYVHTCTPKGSDCVPVRWVAMCKRGHLEDLPWIAFAHSQTRTCAVPQLKLNEGATGDFSEITVQCACGASERLSAALAPDALPWCAGRRPWLGVEGDEVGEDGRTACDQRLTLRTRTASNAYFSQVMSALSIPEQGQELADAVKSVWDVLQAVTSQEMLGTFRQIPKVATALERWPDDVVMDAIHRVRSGAASDRKPLRSAEYEVFLSQGPEKPGELPAWDDTFFARRYHPPDGPDGSEGLPAKVGAIVLAHKLREVRAQVGFTRLEHASPDLEGEYDLGVSSAALSLQKDWLPAIEIGGEGVLISLDEAAVAEWESRPVVLDRAAELYEGHQAWVARLKPKGGTTAAPPFPGVRFYLLHSLSHLLVTAISLECGYAASAIRERLYCAAHQSPMPMAAILLSTGTSGAEGTLGGLIGQGRRLRSHLQKAWDLGVLCSNDPVCAHHSPQEDLGERHLEGAACHGCLFVAESSCERFNQFLDRALVVPTIGQPPELAFFAERP